MRSCKFGLDYFPVDVDFFNDEKIEFTSAKHGILAELIAIKLLSKIYRNGYFIEWNEDAKYLYAKQFGEGISHELLSVVVEELLSRDFFNQRIFAKYNVLTSHGIQKRFLEATKRRKQTEIYKEYLLVSEQNVSIINQNVNIIDLNVNTMSTKTPENVGSGTQRKGKERKEKKRKEHLCAYTPDFERFWEAYPRKVNKKKAFDAWLKCNGNRPPVDDLILAVQRQAETPSWTDKNGQFIPHPTTWINGE
jgi:hypothetical protein